MLTTMICKVRFLSAGFIYSIENANTIHIIMTIRMSMMCDWLNTKDESSNLWFMLIISGTLTGSDLRKTSAVLPC
jgi:hypothetical protein